MKKGNKSISNVQDSKINDLMSSIESKLELLAKDDLEYDMQLQSSQPASLQYEMQSPNKSCSQPQEHSSLKSQMGSPILSRISQLEEKYISRLTVFNQKITILQNENSQLKAINRKLQKQLEEERQKLRLVQQEQQRILDRKVEELRANLLSRMKDEVETQIQGYIAQLSSMREQMGSQRMEKRKLEKDIQLIRFQRNNFEQMYLQIMGKFKQLMQSEVSSYQSHAHQNLPPTNLPSQGLPAYEFRQKEESKKKGEKTKRRKASEMPKEKLIPFLAKGIEELKQKLKLK